MKPSGYVTRGTTNPNRLRRVDRWIVSELGSLLRRADTPAVIDLGFGSSPVTTVELQQRLRLIRPDIEVVGLEIDPDRVSAARVREPGVRFELGGFELGRWADRATVVRAFNVLRQYDESQVPGAWRQMSAGGAVVVDGTCDELGRLASWIRIEGGEPVSLTLSVRLAGLARPSDVAARLPKALIHHNRPGSAIHDFLEQLDRAWLAAAPWKEWGARQRWLHTVSQMRSQGFAVIGGPSRWRLGEISVDWRDVSRLA